MKKEKQVSVIMEVDFETREPHYMVLTTGGAWQGIKDPKNPDPVQSKIERALFPEMSIRALLRKLNTYTMMAGKKSERYILSEQPETVSPGL